VVVVGSERAIQELRMVGIVLCVLKIHHQVSPHILTKKSRMIYTSLRIYDLYHRSLYASQVSTPLGLEPSICWGSQPEVDNSLQNVSDLHGARPPSLLG